MGEITSENNSVGNQARGKVGHAMRYGKQRYGYAQYGETEPVLGPGVYGLISYGKTEYAEVLLPWGIYRVLEDEGKQIQVKEEFYIPANPQTASQQANRSTFTDGVLGWQGLSENEKDNYRERAEDMKMTGFNLYIREYMLSH